MHEARQGQSRPQASQGKVCRTDAQNLHVACAVQHELRAFIETANRRMQNSTINVVAERSKRKRRAGPGAGVDGLDVLDDQ